MVPESKFLQINLRGNESIQAKILKMRLHTNAQRSSFRVAFKCILKFGLKDASISRIGEASSCEIASQMMGKLTIHAR